MLSYTRPYNEKNVGKSMGGLPTTRRVLPGNKLGTLDMTTWTHNQKIHNTNSASQILGVEPVPKELEPA